MTRRIIFDDYSKHAWFSKIFKKLTDAELLIARSFISEHDHLDANKFEHHINRMFLDKPNKPKHFKEILELLSCTNSKYKN